VYVFEFFIRLKFYFFLLIVIDITNGSDDTLERLRNITKMFSGKVNEEDDQHQLQKVEKFAPSAKLKNTFQR
jgi:hypothetical protein